MNENKRSSAQASRTNGKLGGRPKKKPEERKIRIQLYLLPDIVNFIKENGAKIVDDAIRNLKEFKGVED